MDQQPPPKQKRLALNVRFATEIKVERVGTDRNAGAPPPPPPAQDLHKSASAPVGAGASLLQETRKNAVSSSSVPLGSSPAGKSVTAVASATLSSEGAKKPKQQKKKMVAEPVNDFALENEEDLLFAQLKIDDEVLDEKKNESIEANTPMLFQVRSSVLDLMKDKGAKFVKRKSGRCSVILGDGTELDVIRSVGTSKMLQIVVDTTNPKEFLLGGQPIANGFVISKRLESEL